MLKEILPTYRNIINQAMTGTTEVISAVSNISYKDSIAVQLQWTGTPTGQFYVEGSLDYVPGQNGNTLPQNAGTWIALSLSPNPAASGSASQILMNLTQLTFPFIRVRYVNASGTGTLNGYISGKSLG